MHYVFIGDIEEEGEGMSPVLKHLNFIQTFSSIIIVAIENIRLFKESLRQEALKKELELAARMQKMLIPDNSQMPKNPKIIVHGFYFPHYEVGGDYYDCLKIVRNQNRILYCRCIRKRDLSSNTDVKFPGKPQGPVYPRYKS